MECEIARSEKALRLALTSPEGDASTHEVICYDLSINNVTDAEAFSGLIRQTQRKVNEADADCAYRATKTGWLLARGMQPGDVPG